MASELQARGTVRVRAKLCVLVWLCTAGVAAAQSPKANPDAERHHQRGLKLLREEPKDFAAAAAEFSAAYEIDPRPRYMFNLALAQRLGGECRKAIESYRAYLATEPAEVYAKDARTGIERCEQILAAATSPAVAAPPTAGEPGSRTPEVRRPTTGEPGPRTPEVGRPTAGEPGPRTPEVGRPIAGEPGPGTPDAGTLGTGAGRGAEPVDRPPPVRGPWYRDRVGTSLVIAGGVSAIAGAACYALAHDAAASTFDPGPLDDYEASRTRARAFQIASWITAGAGAALIAGGVIRYATRPAARRAELTLRPAPAGIAIVLGGRF